MRDRIDAVRVEGDVIADGRHGVVGLLIGPDGVGAALARAGVNVEEFSSEVSSAPMSGETLFKANARLQLPAPCDQTALKRDLEKIAADLLVDVSFAELGGS